MFYRGLVNLTLTRPNDTLEHRRLVLIDADDERLKKGQEFWAVLTDEEVVRVRTLQVQRFRPRGGPGIVGVVPLVYGAQLSPASPAA